MTVAASTECYPISVMPHVSALYRAYLGLGEAAPGNGAGVWYGPGLEGGAFAGSWIGRAVPGGKQPARLADELERQAREFGAGEATFGNIARLRAGRARW